MSTPIKGAALGVKSPTLSPFPAPLSELVFGAEALDLKLNGLATAPRSPLPALFHKSSHWVSENPSERVEAPPSRSPPTLALYSATTHTAVTPFPSMRILKRLLRYALYLSIAGI